MGNFSSIDISASGLLAQRVRLDAIANNIANVSTTRTSEGGPYKKQEVLLRSRADESDNGEGGVNVEAVVSSDDPPRLVYDPTHPDARPDGRVAMPNINIVEEMIDLMSATRAYEANIQAMTASKTMISKALEIGRV